MPGTGACVESATSEDEALAAAKSIHDYLWAPGTGQASSVFTQARYVVLVGEDKVLPFYRVKDSTGVLPESSYTELSATSTVGAALKASVGAPGGYFLSDDYYGAAEAQETEVGAHELWLPDLAVGRLVQTPTEIAAQVNRFIAQDGEVRPTKALVSGYDFVVDGAQDIAGVLTKPGVTVDSTLIGQLWTPASLKCGLGLPNCSARPQLVSLNGHANHYQLGSAQGVVNATELASVTQTLAGAVVWGMGCHSGLVAPESEVKGLDIVQALNRLGVVAQVGQNGFGWGFRHGVGLSEALMRELSERLVGAPTVGVGDALLEAKRAYFLSSYRYDVFDEKVLQEATLYGLPMYSVVNAQARAGSAHDSEDGAEICDVRGGWEGAASWSDDGEEHARAARRTGASGAGLRVWKRDAASSGYGGWELLRAEWTDDVGDRESAGADVRA